MSELYSRIESSKSTMMMMKDEVDVQRPCWSLVGADANVSVVLGEIACAEDATIRLRAWMESLRIDGTTSTTTTSACSSSSTKQQQQQDVHWWDDFVRPAPVMALLVERHSLFEDLLHHYNVDRARTHNNNNNNNNTQNNHDDDDDDDDDGPLPASLAGSISVDGGIHVVSPSLKEAVWRQFSCDLPRENMIIDGVIEGSMPRVTAEVLHEYLKHTYTLGLAAQGSAHGVDDDDATTTTTTTTETPSFMHLPRLARTARTQPSSSRRAASWPLKRLHHLTSVAYRFVGYHSSPIYTQLPTLPWRWWFKHRTLLYHTSTRTQRRDLRRALFEVILVSQQTIFGFVCEVLMQQLAMMGDEYLHKVRQRQPHVDDDDDVVVVDDDVGSNAPTLMVAEISTELAAAYLKEIHWLHPPHVMDEHHVHCEDVYVHVPPTHTHPSSSAIFFGHSLISSIHNNNNKNNNTSPHALHICIHFHRVANRPVVHLEKILRIIPCVDGVDENCAATPVIVLHVHMEVELFSDAPVLMRWTWRQLANNVAP